MKQITNKEYEEWQKYKVEKATKEDLCVAQDLLDTLIANRAGCVGMAANMIGVRKRIIVFDDNGKYTVMFNLKIINRITSLDKKYLFSKVDANKLYTYKIFYICFLIK